MCKKCLVLLTLLGLALAAALGFYLLGPRPTAAGPRDPRLDYAGPFRNIHPSVPYVADERCALCHADIARRYAGHSMGRSLLPMARAPAPPLDHNNPFSALGSQFQVERAGERVVHRRTRLAADGRPAAELDWEPRYCLGSGTQGHSFLAERDGYLFQTPISWYTQGEKWDLAPGFGPPLLTGRPVVPECLLCHVNRANHVAGSVNHYRQPLFDGYAIGCQRCHGPGEMHVAARERADAVAGNIDTTIVNPRHLERPLREAVCEQCHLGGETRTLHRGRELYDFRPGMPLESFWAIYVRAPGPKESAKAVGHVEQMHQSRCFQASRGPSALGCISCHDPHEHAPKAQRVAYYRDRCLQCHGHGEPECSLPKADRQRKQDSCIDCHMARYGSSDIPHTAATDHRIPKRRDEGGNARKEQHAALEPVDALIPFFRNRKETYEGEDERDRAVALMQQVLAGRAEAGNALPRMLTALDSAVRRDPDDLPAGEARGHVLGLQNHPAEALTAFEAVLAKAPEREVALAGAATMAEAARQTDAAIGYWRRAIAVNPWAPEYRRRLALLLVGKEAWDEALRESDAWVRLDPIGVEPRVTRLTCLLATGKKDEGRAEFARIEALAPANLGELEIRFGRKLK